MSCSSRQRRQTAIPDNVNEMDEWSDKMLASKFGDEKGDEKKGELHD